MTDNNHPITPPEELVLQWMHEASGQPPGPDARMIATQAARWGADIELEACCEWLVAKNWKVTHKHLRDARRPKPPSLKKQALEAVDALEGFKGVGIIRRALESLPD
jgi:hypothetical protein